MIERTESANEKIIINQLVSNDKTESKLEILRKL